MALTVVLVWFWRAAGDKSAGPSVDYSQLYEWIEADYVASVQLQGSVVHGVLEPPVPFDGEKVSDFTSRLPEGDESLLPLLRQKRVRIAIVSDDPALLPRLFWGVLPWVLIIGVWIWLSRRARNLMTGTGAGPLAMIRMRNRRFDRDAHTNVTFGDIAGLGAAKRDLDEVVRYLQDPVRFQRLAAKVPRGVLLIGPPGTGKTLLARAVAGESGVPFFSISASEFIELFVGIGAARVRQLFAEAKKNAPAIVFIDEIDAVGRSRGAGVGGGHDEREQTLNQLLSEMDGFERNDLVVVLAATNRPDVLDPALLRPGRFDRRVLVERPEIDARKAILEVHTREMPVSADVDLSSIAVSTPGFSGADLANLANEAALSATRREADTVEMKDFWLAFDKVVLGDPTELKLGERERHRIAVHEAGHAVAAWYCPDAEPVMRVSIIPRGFTLGATQQNPAGDRHVLTQSQLEARLLGLMGGYASERLILGEVSTGAEHDLKEATKIASKMVAHFGMSTAVGPMYLEHGEEHPFLGRRIATEAGSSDATIHAIENASRLLLEEAMEGASQVLAEHRHRLDQLVATLLRRETIAGDGLVEILGEPAAPTAPHGELAPGAVLALPPVIRD